MKSAVKTRSVAVSIAWVILAGVLPGCLAFDEVGVDVDDRAFLIPALRVRIAPSDDARRRAFGGLEVDIASAAGDEQQRIPTGRFLAIDNEVFIGPTSLDVDARLTRARALVTGGIQLTEFLGVGGLAGVSVDSLRLEVDGPTASDRTHLQSLGLVLGVRLAIDPTEWLRVYGQSSYTVGVGDQLTTEIVDHEVGLSISPQENVAIFGGYRWWTYEAEPDFSSGQFLLIGLGNLREDIDVELSGPMIGVEFRF